MRDVDDVDDVDLVDVESRCSSFVSDAPRR